MAVPNTLGVGVGLRDGALIDANFTAITGGSGFSFTDSITAHAGGTRAAGVALTTTLNRISVCATNADSVLLPAATGGQFIVIANAGAASAQIFAAIGTSDTINAVAAATGIVLATNKTIVLWSFVGAWHGVLTA